MFPLIYIGKVFTWFTDVSFISHTQQAPLFLSLILMCIYNYLNVLHATCMCLGNAESRRGC